MRRFIGAFWGLLICVLITMCGGCKTKKAITTTTHKQTYDSTVVVKETTHTTFSIIDTTRTSEYSKVITEYIFTSPTEVCNYDNSEEYSHRPPQINADGFKPIKGYIPMVVRKSDGTLQINYGLAGIKQTTEHRKHEKKGITQSKDSTTHKESGTKVSATESDKRKDKQIERVQVTEPFDWWQLVFCLSIILGLIFLLSYLKSKKPTIKDIKQWVRRFFLRNKNKVLCILNLVV